MMEVMMKKEIEQCCSHNLCDLINQHPGDLTDECINQILEKTISADMIFVTRTLNKHALLRKAHMSMVWEKCQRGYKNELEALEEAVH